MIWLFLISYNYLVLAFLNLFLKDSVHLLIMVSDNFIICSVLFFT